MRINHRLATNQMYSNSTFADYKSDQQKLEVTDGWSIEVYKLKMNQP
jgi:hypothetical protein